MKEYRKHSTAHEFQFIVNLVYIDCVTKMSLVSSHQLSVSESRLQEVSDFIFAALERRLVTSPAQSTFMRETGVFFQHNFFKKKIIKALQRQPWITYPAKKNQCSVIAAKLASIAVYLPSIISLKMKEISWEHSSIDALLVTRDSTPHCDFLLRWPHDKLFKIFNFFQWSRSRTCSSTIEILRNYFHKMTKIAIRLCHEVMASKEL